MRVLISGGGTAGHINPAISIAKHIVKKNSDAEILFIGTEKGLESKLIPRENFHMESIKVRGFKRKLSLDTFVTVKELFQGLMEARKIIKDYKPDVVIGTGGYVCGPVVFNAARMNIPTLIHEQNAFPGATNRILARFVDKVAISFKESETYFKKREKVVFTGNPLRGEMLEVNRDKARHKLKIKKEEFFVVVFGGSRGAEKINKEVSELIQKHGKEIGFKLLFATGDVQYKKIYEDLKEYQSENINVVPYIYDMSNVMAAADLVVSRAGAITISELTALNVPSILIPSPYVTANHQEHNARALEEGGAAIVILEKDVTSDILYNQIMSLAQDKNCLKKMSSNAGKIAITDAIDKIYLMIRELVKK
ncbi:undecaprenyldiphospho-muramoylpentapeptide beta-N-acetylglucosaminyltransferase [Herbivorax sp. ANBcel31]|uniref:undecaprenyldiphospho-muramoylpentapeptide beta-N-acetylglucosaminyltransferase n=1 Tax=Herbivorax sp. ANBcel31 TaxID=3069754 RepID=UPI0027B2C495|nr:undecaprenyldiphospho-muramoylpentapeptide beta-N-acetylglucosaminyltransferase [Herbivorax sp. ANBcel31]MDQ2086878.1 undecaprenyldiphospho-muramoylpentapeptide beta-N-acetylglucosaminyltransferase [Herbivorax sp. ANBcel31]